MAKTAFLHINGIDYELPGYHARGDSLHGLHDKYVRMLKDPSPPYPVVTERVVLGGVDVEVHIRVASISTLSVYVAEVGETRSGRVW